MKMMGCECFLNVVAASELEPGGFWRSKNLTPAPTPTTEDGGRGTMNAGQRPAHPVMTEDG